MLYFFHGQVAAVVSHGLSRESVVPQKEIDLAITRKTMFESHPAKYTDEEE
jgi:hypothetical protein